MHNGSLKQRQAYPLELKIKMSENRIREWYKHWNGKVYVAFSGGVDSTVLLHLVRSSYPDVPAVFVDTGLEYPELREFVKNTENVVWLKPKLTFKQVLGKKGFPVVSKQVARYVRDLQTEGNNEATKHLRLTGYKRDGQYSKVGKLSKKWVYLKDAPFKVSEQCCDVMKKQPIKTYEKETGYKGFNGMMAEDSSMRLGVYERYGCNAFNKKEPSSSPIMFWQKQDIWDYIKMFGLSYASVYDTGIKRTGCMFCMFGAHLEETPNRFQLMKETHPKQYDYCINKLGCGKVLDYIGVDYK